MKKMPLLFLAVLLSFVFEGCSQKRPGHHPKNPKYKIIKPKVKYKPSRKSLAKMVKQLQGSPYVWAEEGPNQFDCSGFTYYMYGSMGIELPRVAREQAKVGKYIQPQELQYGDLIFFATNKHNRRKITHVGMYLGNGWFTHASTVKHEVIYSNLFTSPYYKKRLRICRRYLPDSKHTTSKIVKTTRPTWKKTSTQKVVTADRTKTTKQKKAIVINANMHEIKTQNNTSGYYVQVGSFSGRPKGSLLNQISRQGYDYKLIHFPHNGLNISKLLIGPYTTHRQAETILADVRNHIEKNAFIAEIR